MHRIASLILGLCLAAAPFAQAEEWSKTFTLTGKPDLRVTTSDANIRVDTWDQNIIRARVTAEGWKVSENATGQRGVKVVQHQSGDSVELEVRLPHNVCIVCIHIPDHRVDVEIHMPRAGRVNLHSSDGSIRLANFKGEMDLQSSDGSLEADGSHQRWPPQNCRSVRLARAQHQRRQNRSTRLAGINYRFRLESSFRRW